MSIQNPERVVTKQDLADFYEQILPYLGGMPEVLANKFSKGDMYSADEKMIGQWVDGKPLYQKTVNFGALPNKTMKTVSAGISDLDYLVSMESLGFSSGWGIPVPNAHPEVLGNAVYMDLDNGLIRVFTNSDKSSITNCYVTLKYTKTTDSPVSIGNDTDYSTDEKIIGTWIDGSPVYQKVLQPASDISITTSWTNLHDVSSLNIKELIRGELHRYPNMGTDGVLVDVSNGYVRAKMQTGTENYYTNGFVILQYTKTS